MDIVILPSNIKLSEVASISQLVHKVGDEGKGICIMGGMFVEIHIILAGMEFAILLLDTEEWGGLWGIGRMNLSSGQVFFEEVFSCFLFVGGERVDLVNLGCEGFVEIDFMIIESGREDVVSCFFVEDLGKVSILHQECDFGFRFFGGNGKFSCHCEFENDWRVWEEPFVVALKDPLD